MHIVPPSILIQIVLAFIALFIVTLIHYGRFAWNEGHFILYGWIGSFRFVWNCGFYHVSDGFVNVRWIFRSHGYIHRIG